MAEVISDAAEVTPEWLTLRLRHNGFLPRGRVSGVHVKSSRTLTVSIVSRLGVEYADDAPPLSPRDLFLKVSNPNFVPALARQNTPAEMVFYNSVSREMPDPPLPRCFDAAFSPATGHSHLLLEDLSETHYHPPTPVPPSLEECEAAVDCLAQLHAHWWEHPRLGAGVGKLLSDEEIRGLARVTAVRFAAFADSLGERLSGERRRTFERVINTFPRPWVRLGSARGLTVTHGDAHTLNFLFPRRPGGGRLYLIDWQLWHPHIGPRDLAYMMTLFWYPEDRTRLEQKLLRRYHQRLEAGGVKDYGWEACWKDYRWSAIRNIFIPTLHWSRGMRESLWWPQVERALSAFEDLGCVELLEG
jgi:hypothetical protein